jgi:hypothetical protein
MPIEFVPFSRQRLARAQLGFPLLPPISAQAARNDHTDDVDKPEMRFQKISPENVCSSAFRRRVALTQTDRLKAELQTLFRDAFVIMDFAEDAFVVPPSGGSGHR